MRGIKRGEKFKGSYSATLLLHYFCCYTTTATAAAAATAENFSRLRTKAPHPARAPASVHGDWRNQGVQGLRLKIHINCTFPSLILTTFLHFQDNCSTMCSMSQLIYIEGISGKELVFSKSCCRCWRKSLDQHVTNLWIDKRF